MTKDDYIVSKRNTIPQSQLSKIFTNTSDDRSPSTENIQENTNSPIRRLHSLGNDSYQKLEDFLNPKNTNSEKSSLWQKIFSKRRYLYGMIMLVTSIQAIIGLSIGIVTATPLVAAFSAIFLASTTVQISKNFYLTRKSRKSVIEYNLLKNYEKAIVKQSEILDNHLNPQIKKIVEKSLNRNIFASEKNISIDKSPTKSIIAFNIAAAAINAVSAFLSPFHLVSALFATALYLRICSTDKSVCNIKDKINYKIKESRENTLKKNPNYKNIEELKDIVTEQKIMTSILEKITTDERALKSNITVDEIEKLFNQTKNNLLEKEDNKKVQFSQFKEVLEDLVRSYGFPRISDTIGRENIYHFLTDSEIEKALKKSSSLFSIKEKMQSEKNEQVNNTKLNRQTHFIDNADLVNSQTNKIETYPNTTNKRVDTRESTKFIKSSNYCDMIKKRKNAINNQKYP